MIVVNARKTYSMELNISKTDGKLFEYAYTYLKLEEVSKMDGDIIDKLFEYFKENFRSYVPYKNLDNDYPSFKIVQTHNRFIKIYLTWFVSKENTHFI